MKIWSAQKRTGKRLWLGGSRNGNVGRVWGVWFFQTSSLCVMHYVLLCAHLLFVYLSCYVLCVMHPLLHSDRYVLCVMCQLFAFSHYVLGVMWHKFEMHKHNT